MSENNEHVRRKVDELAAGNERSFAELREAVGNIEMDTSHMRQELLIEKLHEFGIISDEQLLDFELAFHTKVETALNEFWRQYRAQRDAAPRMAVVKKPEPKLLRPDGTPF